MYSSSLCKHVTLSFIFVKLAFTLPIYIPVIDQDLRTILPRSVPGSASTMNSLQNAQAIVNMQKGLSPTGATGAEVAASIGRPPDGDSGNPGGAAAIKAGLDTYLNAPQPITEPREAAPAGSTGVGADRYMNLRKASSPDAPSNRAGDDAVSAVPASASAPASALLHALAPAAGA